MNTHSHPQEEKTPAAAGSFWVTGDTGLIRNCHVCATQMVELIHAHSNRPEMIAHECPCCGGRVGPRGPIHECETCRNIFDI